MSHNCTVCSYPERNGATLLKKGGVQIKQRVDVCEVVAEGHGWLWSGAVPGNSTCHVWECSAQKGRALAEHLQVH